MRESNTALRFGACCRREWCWYTSATLRMMETGRRVEMRERGREEGRRVWGGRKSGGNGGREGEGEEEVDGRKWWRGGEREEEFKTEAH